MKKFVSLMLSLVMVLSLVPSAFAAEAVNSSDKFTDVPSDAWYLDELNYAVNNGYISGTSATQFSPDGILTRAQFVTILGRMMGVSSSASGVTRFTDVPSNSWYAPYVAWAAAEGYVNGTSQTTFAPESKLTVEQLGTVLANYLNKSGKTVSGRHSVEYTDFIEVSDWAWGNMELMEKYDLLVADKNGHVLPKKQVTRAEAVVSLVRLARGIGMGTEPTLPTTPVVEQKPDVTGKPVAVLVTWAGDYSYNKAVEIRDGLWASGKLTSSMSEKDKAIAYFRWMCINTTYGYPDSDHSLGSSAHTAYGVFSSGRGVCSGLARAYKLFMDIEGISCDYVADMSKNHAWVTMTLDGEFYDLVDVSNGIDFAKSALDGSFDEWGFNLMVDKFFYPDRYEARYQ